MSDNTLHVRHGRLGTWLPKEDKHLANWMVTQKMLLKTEPTLPFHSVILDFKKTIKNNPTIRMMLNEMIDQVPPRYKKHHFKDCDNAYLESVDQMLELLNKTLTDAPQFNATQLVGCPINAILDWCMCTDAGKEAFKNDLINQHLKAILDAWGLFLDSSESVKVLNDGPDGWKCQDAQDKLIMKQYIHKPTDLYWGFKSWNDFFTRSLIPGVRPIDQPDNSKVIVSACDATVNTISFDAKLTDKFWLKEQPYSLLDMMNNNPLAYQFDGGVVYQAFLCAFDYHRWHSPVSGTIRSAEVVNGTYYSESPSVGFDVGSPDLSQGYIAHVATRAIIYIEADDPKIGMVCVVPIGMAEISSCVINENIKENATVKKGDELGYFQFGGSTHCVVFKKDVIKKFTVREKSDHRPEHGAMTYKPNMGEQIAETF